MDEDAREELIYSLLDEFRASVGSITDEQKYAFIAGARSALVTAAATETRHNLPGHDETMAGLNALTIRK